MKIEEYLYQPHTHCFLGLAYTPTFEIVWDTFVVPFKCGAVTIELLKKLYQYERLFVPTITLEQLKDICIKRLRETREVPFNSIKLSSATFNKIIVDEVTLQEYETYFIVTVDDTIPYNVLLVEHKSKIDDNKNHRVPYIEKNGRYATHPNIENYGMWLELKAVTNN